MERTVSDRERYYNLTLLLLRIKTLFICIIFAFHLSMSAYGAAFFSFLTFMIFASLFLVIKKSLNLTRFVLSTLGSIMILAALYLNSQYGSEPLNTSSYILIFVSLVGYIFIPVLIYNFRTERKWIIPLMIFSTASILFIDEYFILLGYNDVVASIHGELSPIRWKATIFIPFLSIVTTLILLVGKITHYDRSLAVNNSELLTTIKELKQTQKNLIQSEKMASLGTLTAGVAHEINNPLNFISGGVNIIDDVRKELNGQIPKDLKIKYENAFHIVKSGIDRAISIITALSNFSFRGNPVLVRYSVQDLVDNSLLLLNVKNTKDIQIEKDYQYDGQINIYPEKMHQVVYQILENAIYELNHRNQEQKIIKVSTEKKNEKILIDVFNNGPKIPEDILEKIFDPFYSTKGENGTGLGLSICYTLVEENQGKMSVSNTEHGVNFCIELKA